MVYIRSGHYNYVRQLKEKRLLTSNRNNFKPRKYSISEYKENDIIFASVRDISFESKPFLSVKLRLQEEHPLSGALLDENFDIQYLYWEEVPDFLVLKCEYDKSLYHEFSVGNAIRTLILDNDNNHWYFGTIVDDSPLEEISHLSPASPFKKFKVNFTVGNWIKRLSPWEMEQIECVPDRQSEPICSTDKLYEPVPEDWPNCIIDNATDGGTAREMECAALSAGKCRPKY